jgi:hypothetical protein
MMQSGFLATALHSISHENRMWAVETINGSQNYIAKT